MHVQLLTAKHYWERTLGPGSHINIRTEIGPVEEEFPGLTSASAQKDLERLVLKHYRGSWTLNTIPVVFVASIGGLDINGVTSTLDPKQRVAIALRASPFGSPDRTLAHEIGHALSLKDVGLGFMFWRLMNGAGAIGENLTSKELEDARKGFAIRNGVR